MCNLMVDTTELLGNKEEFSSTDDTASVSVVSSMYKNEIDIGKLID